VTPPESGCYVAGLKLEGARWDLSTECLAEGLPRRVYEAVPPVWFRPCILPDAAKEVQAVLQAKHLEASREDSGGGGGGGGGGSRGGNERVDALLAPAPPSVQERNPLMYECPLYLNSKRGRAGHIIDVRLRASEDLGPSHWACRGAALLCEADE